jgi:hypothetical protein
MGISTPSSCADRSKRMRRQMPRIVLGKRTPESGITDQAISAVSGPLTQSCITKSIDGVAYGTSKEMQEEKDGSKREDIVATRNSLDTVADPKPVPQKPRFTNGAIVGLQEKAVCLELAKDEPQCMPVCQYHFDIFNYACAC